MAGPTVYYVRHGQTDWNAEERFQGRRDIPLNDIGREQASNNGKKLAGLLGNANGFEFISSPLCRATETMEIIQRAMGVDTPNYEVDGRLTEVSYGTLEGTTQPELKQQNRELYYFRKQNAWSFRPENGESQEDVLSRIAEWHQSLDANRKYIVTAHGAVGRVMRHHVAGVPTDEVARYPFPQDKVFLFSDGTEQLI
ncbi:MAG: histidine phosphatase family protein [Pseudomonadota bacterium]